MAKLESSKPGKKLFHKHVERAIAHNEKNEAKKSLHIHYKKLNGRTVKRKIDPLSMKGHTLVAYDHKRKALRSFRMERVKHMEKSAFWVGFEKQAEEDSLERSPPASSWTGGIMGAAAGHAATKYVTPRVHVKNNPKATTAFQIARSLAALGGGAVGATRGSQAMGALRNIAKKQDDKYYAALKEKKNQKKEASAFGHAAELGGLGVLAAPSVQRLRGKPMDEKAEHKTELAGLGILAAPSAAAAAKGAWNAAKKFRARG